MFRANTTRKKYKNKTVIEFFYHFIYNFIAFEVMWSFTFICDSINDSGVTIFSSIALLWRLWIIFQTKFSYKLLPRYSRNPKNLCFPSGLHWLSRLTKNILQQILLYISFGMRVRISGEVNMCVCSCLCVGVYGMHSSTIREKQTNSNITQSEREREREKAAKMSTKPFLVDEREINRTIRRESAMDQSDRFVFSRSQFFFYSLANIYFYLFQ